jgi:mannose/cellobiose epimerase-like protein (N-acyl-D-glucosamine 2-epimerase family)
MRLLVKLCFALTFSVSAGASEYPLPTGEEWLTHAQQGLAPYWMMPEAQGEPVGNFPTFRCDDGSLMKLQQLCSELKQGWMEPHYAREYTRMKSRQTYAYGVLFHLTGDPQALKLAKAGVDYLLNELRDIENGGFYSFTINGNPGLEWTQRTSQDLSYALVGLAMYYYLTRDKEVEKVLIDTQAFIFEHYKDIELNELKWVIKNGDGQSNHQRELVAQLDQINAYMLLVTPLLPEPFQSQWRSDLDWLIESMIDNYYSAADNRFYGAIHDKFAKQQSARHNDYGHTVKAFWMTYLSGRMLDNEEFEELGWQGLKYITDAAASTALIYQVDRYFSDELKLRWKGLRQIPIWISGPYDYSISSWQWAELAQASMTLHMLEGSQTKHLHYTHNLYFDAWVDHEFGGVGMSPKSVKAFHWGNGYHQFEHALVGYLSAQQHYNQPATLYYALPLTDDLAVSPYYYQAKTQAKTQIGTEQVPILKVEFIDVTP